METTTAASVLVNVPFLIPLAGLGAFLFLFAVSILVLLAITYISIAPLRAPAIVPGSDVTGNSGATGPTVMAYIITTQVPGWGAFASMYDIIGTQLGNLLSSLTAFLSTSFLIVLLSALVAAIGFAIMFFGNDLLAAWGQTYQCQVLPFINPILVVINTLNYLVGSVYPLVTYFFSLLFVITGLAYRIALTCVFGNAEVFLFGIILSIGNILLAFWTAVQNFLLSNDLANERLDLLPFMAAVASLGDSFVILFDCMCTFLDFLWVATFGLLGDASLASFVDCLGNVPIRLVQAFAIAVNQSQSLNFNATTLEVQCVVLSAGDFIEVLVLYLLNVAADLVNFIPVSMTASPDAIKNAEVLGLSPADVTTMRINMATGRSTTLDSIRIIMALRDPNTMVKAVATNTSDLIGIGYLIGIAGTPYMRIFTEPLAGLWAAVNNTLNLALMATEATSTFEDIRFFELGYIFDWFRGGALALGQFAAGFYSPLEFVVAGIPSLFVTVWQITGELLIFSIFTNVYAWNGNPFSPAATYCNETTGTAAVLNYNTALNNSASWAVLFGCNASLNSFPLDSVGATCSDSVFGCLAMSLYRLLLEVVTLLEKTICYFSVIVQFNASLGLTFEDLDIQPTFRQAINLAVCIQRALYAFIIILVSFPFT